MSHVRFVLYFWAKHWYKIDTIRICNIYVRRRVPLQILIYLFWQKDNSKHLMLNYSFETRYFIKKFDQYLLRTNMWSLWFFIVHLMTLVYVELTADLQNWIRIMKTVFQYTRNRKEIFSTPMLVYMVTYTSSISSIYI